MSSPIDDFFPYSKNTVVSDGEVPPGDTTDYSYVQDIQVKTPRGSFWQDLAPHLIIPVMLLVGIPTYFFGIEPAIKNAQRPHPSEDEISYTSPTTGLTFMLPDGIDTSVQWQLTITGTAIGDWAGDERQRKAVSNVPGYGETWKAYHIAFRRPIEGAVSMDRLNTLAKEFADGWLYAYRSTSEIDGGTGRYYYTQDVKLGDQVAIKIEGSRTVEGADWGWLLYVTADKNGYAYAVGMGLPIKSWNDCLGIRVDTTQKKCAAAVYIDNALQSTVFLK